MKLLVVDSSKGVGEQLRHLSEVHHIPLESLFIAWNNQHCKETVQAKPSDIYFDLLPEVQEVKPEKKVSYIAAMKKLPKFLR